MAKVKNRVRDESTGAGINGLTVAINRKNGGSAVTTETTDSTGTFDYEANGSPGDVEWEATDSGKTRVVAGDMSVQTGHWFTGELWKFFQIWSAGVAEGADNELAVSAPGGMNVAVATGFAVGTGLPYCQYSSTNYAVTSNASGNPRIDRVIVRWTRTGTDAGKAEIVVKAGTPAASPSAPALTQDASTWELSLAQIAVANGAAAITSGNITDERSYAVPNSLLPGGEGDKWVEKAGDTMTGALTTTDLTATGNTALGNANSDLTTIHGRIRTKGTKPTVAVGAGAGSGSPNAAITGNDHAGFVTLNMGTSPTVGTLATVTFAQAKPNTAYVVQLLPEEADALTDIGKVRVGAKSTSGWSIIADAACNSNQHIWNYTVVEVEEV